MENKEMNRPAACEAAEGVKNLYEDFTATVQSLGAKGKKSSKMRGSLIHWIGGSHVTTDREQICEKFLADVQSRLDMIENLLEGESQELRTEVADILAEIMMEPRPAASDSTTDLMKRAMIGQMEAFLQDMSEEALRKQMDRMDQAYSRWNRLPVEKEIYKKMKALL